MPGRGENAEIQDFVDTFDVGGFEHVIDESGDLWAAFGVRSQPSFAFINDDGTIETVQGRQGEDSLTERIDLLLSS